MTKKFMALLVTLLMSFAFSSSAEEKSALETGYVSTGVGMGFWGGTEAEESDQVEFTALSLIVKYGSMLTEYSSLSTGIVLHVAGDLSSLVFRGSYDHFFPTTNKRIIPGIETYIDFGMSGDFDSFGFGFGVGAIAKYMISEKRATAFRLGLQILPQPFDQLNINSESLSAYMGMNFYFQ